LEPLWASKISQTILFSKPFLLAGGKIAQIGAESQFSPDFGIPKINPNNTIAQKMLNNSDAQRPHN
jgi:hypothetical protein